MSGPALASRLLHRSGMTGRGHRDEVREDKVHEDKVHEDKVHEEMCMRG